MLSAVLFIVSACVAPSLPDQPIFDGSPLATPCVLTSDSARIILRDYFPKLSYMDTITVKANSASNFISFLTVQDSNDVGALVIFKKTPKALESADSTKVPQITTFPSKDEGRFVLVMKDVDPAQIAVLWQNSVMNKIFFKKLSDNEVEVTVPSNAKRFARSYIRVYAANKYGIGNDVLVPLDHGRVISDVSELNRSDKRAQIMYFLMIDRFKDGDTSNTKKLNVPNVLPKVDYYGGDIAGIDQVLKSGYFDSLGVNTIWISPVTQNPYDAWGQIYKPKTQFSGYHGYWPIYATAVDKRFGTAEELKGFLADAHADNKNVILDYVSNHMHINSPTLKAHPDWVTSNVTPDGRPNFQLWDEFRLTTWFDKHIPSLDLEKEYVYKPMTDSALFWMKNFDFDGYRHDATKHIPEVFWRMLTRKIIDSLPADRSIYQIGETYGSLELINSYVKPGMMDGQFDFNVYDSYIAATTDSTGSFKNLWNTINSSLTTYGYHNLMGYITGNQDRARYTSIAGGDLKKGEDWKEAGWSRDIEVSDTSAYRLMAMLEAMNMTLPGVPCIYYGDEFGQGGANDPDNRRWMRFSGLNPNEAHLLAETRELIKLRAGSLPLIYGDFFPLVVSDDVLVYLRCYMGKYVICGLNKSRTVAFEQSVALPEGLKYDGSENVDIKMAPLSYSIIIN
jgi:cyclomaltodextrinase